VGSIGRALEVHSGEARLVVLMTGLSFAASAGQVIGQSGANALFFERVGTDALPLMYLLQGAAAFVLMVALTSALGRVDRRRAYLAAPALLAIVVVAERAALVLDAPWVYAVLWLTVALAILVQAVFVWGIAGVVTDARQAKRLFPLFAAGGILGSVVGGVVTAPLARIVGSENLLLVWAGSLVATVTLCRAALPPTGPRPRGRRAHQHRPVLQDLAGALGYVMRSRLLAWMAVAAVLFSVLYYSLFLPWATAATEHYPNADDLAGFIGFFWAATTGLAFLASMFAANRLFGRFGIASMVVLLPVLYVGSFGVLLVSSAFATLVAVRFVTGVWLQGVASPGWETLTNVVPEARRDQVRTFFNCGPSQAGTAIAGVIAIVGQQALSTRQLAGVGLIAAALTVFATVRIRASYASALVEALRAGRPVVFPDVPVGGLPVAFDRDADALRTVLEAADDERPSVRRLAVQLLAEVDDERARSFLERALGDGDATVRAEAVAALAPSLDGLPLVRPLVEDDDARVAAAAAAALAGRVDDPAPARRLRELAEDPDPAVRATTVEQLRLASQDVAAPIASGLLKDASPAVRAAALQALAPIDTERTLELAIRLLEDPSPRVRETAADACGSSGDRALDPLLAALDRPPARDAALRGLTSLDLAGREQAVRTFAGARTAEASRDLELIADVPPDGDAADLLRATLLDRARRNGRTALRALSLVSADGSAMLSAIDNLDARDGGQVANALETLEATADPRLLRPLLPLWEHADAAPRGTSMDWRGRVLNDEDALVRSCGELVLAAERGVDGMARARAVVPLVERVLFLRKVPLFDALAPADLQAIAEIAEEETFADREFLAAEGELGESLHLVMTGDVIVESAGVEVARRGPGDVVGEMSLITRSPRMASVVADGDVRAIKIDRRAFEGMVHDRPDVALGVMRVLAHRLAEHRPEG
jgi:HEAT repeat protein